MQWLYQQPAQHVRTMSAVQVRARMHEIQNPSPTKTGSQHGYTFSQYYGRWCKWCPGFREIPDAPRNQSLFCTELNKQRRMDINLMFRWHSHVNNPFSNQRMTDGRSISGGSTARWRKHDAKPGVIPLESLNSPQISKALV